MARPHIYLDGQGLFLDPEYDDRAFAEAPQDNYIGKDGKTFWQTWAMRSWHSGERLERLLTFEHSPDAETGPIFQYHDGQGFDVSKRGWAKLQPALARSLEVQSSSMPMVVTTDGDKLVLGLSISPYIKTWTYAGGWANATSVAKSGAVTDLCVAGDTLYAVRGGAVLKSVDDAATWTEQQYQLYDDAGNLGSLTSFSTAQGVAFLNQELYVCTIGGVMNVDQHEYVIDTVGGVAIAAFRENLYWLIDRRLWCYDGRAAYVVDMLPEGFVGTALLEYRMMLWVVGYYREQGEYRTAIYYLYNGTENHLYSLDDYRIYAGTGGDDEYWFANPGRGGADRYDITYGGLSAGPAWGAAGNIPFKSMAALEGYLFVGRYDGVAGTDGVYVANLKNPSAYVTSAWLTSPAYDFEFNDEEKILRSITAYHKPLTAGQSIKMEYSLDDGESYVEAGRSDTVGTYRRIFEFANTRFDNLKLRMTAYGPGTTQTAVRKVLVKACAVSEAKWQWQIHIFLKRVATKSGRKLRDYAVIERLESIRKSGVPVEFVDRIGERHSVMLEDYEIDQKALSQRQGRITIKLLEV